jgi:hypothetical protein
MKLTSKKVREVYLSCALQAEAEGKGPLVEGITGTFVLAQLPSEFKQSGSGDSNGDQWTGAHVIIEMLIVMDIAAGKAKWLFPRAMWGVLPGGIPYAVVLD